MSSSQGDLSRSARGIESKALAAENAIASKLPNSNAALEAAITSAELYMQALKLTTNPNERKRLDQKTKDLLSKAELIKAAQDGRTQTSSQAAQTHPQPKSIEPAYPQSTRKLTTRESIILLEGSKLNGMIFKPWTVAPKVGDFELSDPGGELYLDLPHLPLSLDQRKSFAGWKRPKEALGMLNLKRDGMDPISDPTMDKKDGKIDLVQDMTSDCSVVASLCAGTARAERGHQRILGSILHPSSSSSTPLLSPSGKYILRLYFNGTYRSVPIDDLLPTSSSDRMLHVIDRTQPSLLWPALVEKAYLKVRGGYDFPGSNSGTDLAVLTGWIPQQVFLHDEEDVVDRDMLWGELYNAFERGNMLLTIGTGKLPRREQKVTGLAAEHDYAILELVESWKQSATEGGEAIKVREMLIKNPWSDGDVWIGAAKRRPNPSQGNDSIGNKIIGYDQTKMSSDDAADTNDNVDRMMPGTFWMDFNSVFHYFENMYINWNPSIFSHRQDIHFSWNVPEPPFVPNVFVDNPQFAAQTYSQGEVWILLNRHFRTGDYTNANSGKNGYISLYLFDSDGMKVLSSEGATTRGPFVDSPNTLLRFQAEARKSYTAVVVSQDLPAGKHNFTLSVFAKSTLALEESQLRYRDHASLAAAWTRSTAGGNSDSIRYLSNPQFNFTVTGDDTKVALMLRITSDSTSHPDEINTHVKLLVLANPSTRRITKLRPRDIVANSSDYRRGSAVLETTLSRGTYAIICSTFEEHQLAKFQLDLYTSSPTTTTLKPIPPESSGRHSILTPPVALSHSTTKVLLPLLVPQTTRAIFIARPLARHPPGSNFLYQLSLQRGRGPYAHTLATSADDAAEFTHASRGLRIEDLDLTPTARSGVDGLWLALQRPRAQTVDDGAVASAPALEVEILADERVEVGEWEAVDE